MQGKQWYTLALSYFSLLSDIPCSDDIIEEQHYGLYKKLTYFGDSAICIVNDIIFQVMAMMASPFQPVMLLGLEEHTDFRALHMLHTRTTEVQF